MRLPLSSSVFCPSPILLLTEKEQDKGKGGGANSLFCCDCSPEKQQAAVGLLWQVPEDEMLAAFLSIGAQGKPSLLDSGTTFPGPREGDLGWSPRGYLPHLVQEVRLQWLLLLA